MKLTLPQQDIFFEQLIFPNEPIYNIGAKIIIEGNLDYNAFQKAYVCLIEQHDSYRTHLNHDFSDVKMLMTDEIRPLELFDFSQEKHKDMILDFIQTEFIKPFDIENDKYLYRFVLIKESENNHYLFSVYHHLITDGWGTSLMFNRLVSNYNEILEFGEVQSEYPFSYSSFVEDDQKYIQSKHYEIDKNYWVDKCKILPETFLPKLDPNKISNTSSRKEFIIKREDYNKLIELANQTKSTTFHVILAILYVYFYKRYQNNLISIGLPVLNRSGASSKKTVGLFMGINPLLIFVDESISFLDLIDTIKAQLRRDYRHQRFPLGKLIKELGIIQEKEKLFNITLSYEKQDYSVNFSNTITKVIPLSHCSERVGLALYIREFDSAEDVKIDFDYNLNFFTRESIDRLVQHFDALMKEVEVFPTKKIGEFNYLTQNEFNQLTNEFNATNIVIESDKTILDFIKEKVIQNPNKKAIVDALNSYTYLELDDKSNAIAYYLNLNHGYDNSPVGVLVERSSELIILLLGILKSGKCYIPIDPLLPKERVDYIIEHSQASLIITEESVLANFSINDNRNKEIKYDYIFKSELLALDLTTECKSVKVDSNDTAYVIYTSGSTGNPKGVEIGHSSLANFLISMRDQPGFLSNDILYSVTTYSFDISILEFFAPLLSGATLYIATKETLNDVELIKRELQEVKPTIIQSTPSFFQMLLNSGWEGDKKLKVLCGGDSLNASLAEKILLYCGELWNMYGPTETTIWSTLKKINLPTEATNIGKPINNTQVYIVDKNLDVLPVDTVGRIFIGGAGLAKGYFKNNELTNEKFVQSPFDLNTKIYETGDLGKWKSNGEIEFLGRDDFQVKVRGYRIELGEVETQIQGFSSAIKHVVANAKTIKGEKVLIAYYTTEKEDAEIDKIQLRDYLANKLPDYMIPSFFIELESIPLTPNAKVDRKALPDIKDNDVIRREFIAPRNNVEKALVDIWKEILKIDDVSIKDNFFELGGHSLSAGKIANRIVNKMHKAVTLKHMFMYDTIEALAQFLINETDIKIKRISAAEQSKYYPVTVDQRNIWLASQRDDFLNSYNMYSVFEIYGDFEKKEFQKTLQLLVNKYEVLRTNFVEFNGEIKQIIHHNKHFVLDTIFVNDENLFSKTVNDFVSQIFDLESDMLLKVGLFETNQSKKYIAFLTHHIIVDGMSLEILLKELIDTYSNQKVSEKIVASDFKDYANWQYNTYQNGEYSFWNQYLKNKNHKTISLLDRERGLIKQRTFKLELNQFESLKKMSQAHKVTTSSAMLSITCLMLSKLFRENTICLGTVFNGRDFFQFENSIGMFIKTLPFVSEIDEEVNFSNFLNSIQDNFRSLEENSSIPFEKDLSTLTDILFVYQHSDALSIDRINFRDFSMQREKISFSKSRFPVIFNFYEYEGLKCEIEYDENLSEEMINSFWDRILILIEILSENSNLLLKDIDVSTAQELQNMEMIDISFDF